MPADDAVRSIVEQWIYRAEGDLQNASHALKLGRQCPTETVAFHAQQCVEKYIKAVLIFNAIDFPMVHDIEKLVRLLPVRTLAFLTVTDQRILTSYAVTARYPGDFEPISLGEARESVRMARRIRTELRKLLPREVRRKRMK
jgi:HEPN domain-containing protein